MIDIPESVKEALKKDRSRKDFIVHFPNRERADITNESVTKNAVKLAESLCSKQYLKFGLTEASEIDFETVGVENIIGREIECAYDVYSHEVVGKDLLVTEESDEVAVLDVEDGEFDYQGVYNAEGQLVLDLTDRYTYLYCSARQPTPFPGMTYNLNQGNFAQIVTKNNADYLDKIIPDSSDVVIDQLQFAGRKGYGEPAYMLNLRTEEFEQVGWYYFGEDYNYFWFGNQKLPFVTYKDVYTKEGSIPLGRFTVKSCPRNHEDMTRRKVTAYSAIKDGTGGYEEFKLKDRWYYENALTIDVQDTVQMQERVELDYNPALSSQDIKGLIAQSATSLKIATGELAGVTNDYYLIWSRSSVSKLSGQNQSLADLSFSLPDATDTMAELDLIYASIVGNDSYTILVDKEMAYQCMQALYAPYLAGRSLSWIQEDVSMGGTRQYFVRVDRDTVYSPKSGETVLIDMYSNTTRPLYYTCFLGGAICHNSASPIYGRINTAQDNKRSIHAEGYVNLYAKISGAPSCTLTLSSTGEQGTGNSKQYNFTDAYDPTKLCNGWLELNALFGAQQRDGSYALKHLSRDKPIEISKDLIGRLWWDEYDVEPIGSVKYSFKSGSEQQIAVYQFGSGKSEYDMTGNYVLLNMDNASMSNINTLAIHRSRGFSTDYNQGRHNGIDR